MLPSVSIHDEADYKHLHESIFWSRGGGLGSWLNSCLEARRFWVRIRAWDTPTVQNKSFFG